MSNRARGSGAGEHRQGVTLTGLARADIDIADSIHGVGLGSDQTASHDTLKVLFVRCCTNRSKPRKKQKNKTPPTLRTPAPRPSPNKEKNTPRSLSSRAYAALTATRSILRDDHDISQFSY